MDAALLAGILATQGIGERPLAPDVTGRVTLKDLMTAEGYFSPADKIESPGWLAKASADLNLGPAILGIGHSYRKAQTWDKHATMARAGLQNDLLRLLIEYDLTSQNKVMKAEGRLRGRFGNVRLEPHAFYERFKDSQGKGQSGWGAGISVGVGSR